MHLDIPTGAVLRAFLASVAEFELELVGIALNQGFDNRVILAKTPAITALKTHATAHATFGLLNCLFHGQCVADFRLHVF